MRVRFHLAKGTTKNRESRLIFLDGELHALMEREWIERAGLFPDCLFIFRHNGSRIKDIRTVWARACRDAKLSGRIPHDLRPTAVRSMVRAGILERVAMQISGHKTRDVFERYDIVSEGDLREAARRLEVDRSRPA